MRKQSVQAISQNNLFKLICHWAFCQHYSIQSKQQCLKCLHESPRSKKNSKPSLSVSHVIFFALEYLFSALLYLSSALCHVKTTFLLANQNDGICECKLQSPTTLNPVSSNSPANLKKIHFSWHTFSDTSLVLTWTVRLHD